MLLERKGITRNDLPAAVDAETFRQSQYELLATALRESLDMDKIQKIFE